VSCGLPLLYKEDETFALNGHKLLRAADRPAVVLAASGYLVHSCLTVADMLAARGIAAAVIDAYALPFDSAPVLDLARRAGCAVLAVEDNYVGGLGTELAEAAAPGVAVKSLAVRVIPKSGRSADDVLAYVQLSLDDIIAAAEQLARLAKAAE
jgi:transketolase